MAEATIATAMAIVAVEPVAVPVAEWFIMPEWPPCRASVM